MWKNAQDEYDGIPLASASGTKNARNDWVVWGHEFSCQGQLANSQFI